MSQRRFPDPPLAPEDDWFYDPDEAPARRRAARSQPSTERTGPDRPHEPEGPPDRRILLAIAIGAAILLIGGVVAAFALTGSDGDDAAAPPTTPATTTPPTTAPQTTPTPTTPPETTPTTPDPTVPEGVVLRPGDESEDVSRLQAVLGALGYSTGGVDGKFGPATEQAVREFQSSSGLEDDGVVGPATLSALADALARR